MVVGQGTRLFPDTGPDTVRDLVDSRASPWLRRRHQWLRTQVRHKADGAPQLQTTLEYLHTLPNTTENNLRALDHITK